MEKNLPSLQELEAELQDLRNSNATLEKALQAYSQENAQLQEKLRETSEVKYILDQHAVVSITDENGIIIYTNDKFCQLSGYSSRELRGNTYQVISSGFHPPSFFADLWQTILKGSIWRGQIKNKAKDDTFYWTDAVITPLLTKEGVPYQYMAVYTDITPQKKNEENISNLLNETQVINRELQSGDQDIRHMLAHTLELNNKISESTEIFRAIANTPPVLLWMSDAKGNCMYVNGVWQNFTGKIIEQEIGWGWENDIHSDDLAHVLTVYKEAFKKRETFTMEYRLKRHDGVFRWMLEAGGPRFRQDGSFLGYVSSLIDVTQQKQIEAHLKQREAHYRLISENMQDIIGLIDVTGRYLYVSPSIKPILGFDPEEFIGKTPLDYVHPDDIVFVQQAFNQIFQEKGVSHIELRFRKKTGQYIWLESISRAVADEAGNFTRTQFASRDITERKKSEASMRLFQFCIENSSDSIFGINHNAQIFYVNQAACKLLGYTKEELLQMQVQDIDPLYRDEKWIAHRQALQSQSSVIFESVHTTKKGDFIPVEVSENYLNLEGNEYSFAFARDISERRAAEQSLRFNNYILSLVKDAIVGIDSNNIVVYWSKAAELQYGLAATEALGKPLSECYQYEWLNGEDELKAMQNIARSGYCHVENIHVLKNGKKIHIESDVQQINFPDSGLIGLFAVIRDITARKKAEADLLNYAQRSITILESITDAMLILNHDWQVSYLNKQAEAVLGIPREEMLHKDIWKIYPTVVDTTFYHQYYKAFKENTDVHFEEYFEPLNKWFEVHAYPSSEGLSIYFRSIQERKIAEENLKNTLDELKRRNYELDNYVYKVSHDLRAPLSSILGLINLIRLENNIDTIRQYVSLIENRINKSDQFIHSVLNHSRILNSQVQVSKIDFNKIISESYEELMYISHSEKLRMEITVSGDDSFYNDEFRLNIIFKNFISNAIKYMNLQASYSYLRFNISLSEKEAIISIEDNGIGIEETYLEKIFDMFFRATEKSDGSGLGLYIVKQTLERIGGHIHVKSEWGKGTTFTITLRNMS